MDSSPSLSLSSLSLSSLSLSLSSSPAGDIWDHDVFLSFRGIDTRKTFTSHLHHALTRSGIRIFIDDEELPSGEVINPKLRQAIQRSRASVIVFSQNYASSAWCLEELVEILECKRSKGQMVFPIYYDVEPSVLRFLTGKYAEAFEKHTSRLVDIHKVQKWGDALREVADLKGHVLANEENGNEARFIHKIVGKVQVEVIARSNHILILGWSDKLGSLLKQLAIANKSIGGGVIVVLAERDKEDMEMDISKFELDFMGTSVICRSGSPLILADLKKVSVSKARAIIVLASDENADKSDAHALKVVLSLTGVKEGLRGHVVVEMSELDNEPLMKLVGGELIETVVAHVVIGRLMIQCALQPGLAQIWEDILGFENVEFHIKRWPQLDGKCFKDVLISFPDAIPCGVKVAADGGKIFLNPDDKYVLREGDEVLVIAEGDNTYAPGPIPEVRRGGICPKITDPPKYPEKILFCGWRRNIDDMIMVLEAILAPLSELWMFNEMLEKERVKKLNDGGLDISGLVNIKLVHREGNTVIRRHLESLPLETFDSILILADDSVENSIVHSDSRSIATLLLIRDIQSKRFPSRDRKSIPLWHSGFSHSSWTREMQQSSNKSIIISEILDSRTRNLVSVSRISDYVLSSELVSMALAMVAEDKQINRVLEELFAEEGHEMYIKRSEFYLYDQEELCFYDIMIRGRQRDEIVIGYRLATAERAIINPVNKYELRKWSTDDVFVVISLGEC